MQSKFVRKVDGKIGKNDKTTIQSQTVCDYWFFELHTEQ